MQEGLDIAQRFIAEHVGCWPTICPNSDVFIARNIIGGGYFSWLGGVLVDNDPSPREPQVKFETALSLSRQTGWTFFSFPYDSGDARAPISQLPDDLEDSWRMIINSFLFGWEKITPAMYAVMIKAFCIQHYHVEHNPHANLERYLHDYERFHRQIPNWKGRLRNIDEQQRTGKIPLHTFVGMNI